MTPPPTVTLPDITPDTPSSPAPGGLTVSPSVSTTTLPATVPNGAPGPSTVSPSAPAPLQGPPSPAPSTPTTVSLQVNPYVDLFESSASEPAAAGGMPANAAESAPTGSRYPMRHRSAPQRFTAAAATAVNAGAVPEPATYKEAMNSPQADEWLAAMSEEMESLLANRTWTTEPVPPGARVIPVKWVYKVKRGSDGQIQHFKARLVAKGFKQIEGVDFTEVFAPVSKHATLRTFLALVATQDLELHQIHQLM